MAQELKDTSLFADANLKAYYRFESGALTTDSSTGGHTLTAISDPAEGTGKFGGGVDLDGNDAYSATDHADFKPTGAFSVGCWFKTSNAGAQVFFQSQSQNTNVAGYILYINAGNIVFQSGKNSGTTYHTDYDSITSTLNTYANGVWHQVTGVYDGSYLRLYVDGVVAGTAVSWANAPAYAATNYVRVGCYNISGADSLMLTGSLDDLFLLNGTALTAAQVANLYNRGIKKINGVYMGSQEIASTRFAGDANLVGYWRLEGNSLDETANNNDGTDTSITYGTAYGKFGQGALFNGSSSKIVLTTTDSIKVSTFTYITWVNTSSASYRTILGGSSSGNPQFRINTNHTLELLKQGVASIATSTGTVPTAGWHQVAVGYNGTNYNFYIDGSNAGSGSASQTFSFSNFQIGTASTGAEWFNGNIDDLAIFSRALTSDEIYSLYKTGVKKLNGQVNLNPELESTSLRGDANLQMYQRFEGNSTDETANNNDGTDTGITYGTTYGKMGQGASFTNDDSSTAASSYIRMANSASLSPGTGNFSISLWYKTSDTRTSNIHGLLMKYNSTNNNNVYYIIEAATTGYITAFYRDGDGDGVTMAATKSYKDGLWHHIVSVRNGTSGHLYIDGNLIASATNVAMSNIDTNTAGSYFWIGTWSANTTPGQRTQSFTGALDDVAIFSRALTATEISNLYNTNIKKYMGVSNV